MSYTAIDIFAGAGGFSIGMERAGLTVVRAVDNWTPAVRTYAGNFSQPCMSVDVCKLTDVELTEWRSCLIDVIVGGPPCQGFSAQRPAMARSDPRNELVFEFVRVVSAIEPRIFVMENVPGILSPRNTSVVAELQRRFYGCGYDVRHRVLDAVDFGVAQFRRRVFFVGTRIGTTSPFHFPSPTHSTYRTVQDAIGDLPSPPADFMPLPTDPLHRRTRLSQRNLDRLARVPPGGGFEDLPVWLRAQCHRDGATKIGRRSVYGRLAADRPSNTITARFDSFTRGRFGHPWEHRNISLREGARLQGFDDGHIFRGTQEDVAAQIGNAVPPPVAEAIGTSVVAALRGERIGRQQELPFGRSRIEPVVRRISG